MSNPPPGKGRSRARGRARQSDDVIPQPGQHPPMPVQPQPQPPPPVASVYPGAMAGGRKSHRGTQRSEVDPLVHAMAEMQVAGDSAGRGAMRRRDEYELDNTRPPHLTDKCGTSGSNIRLVANYFDVMSKHDWVVYQYDVKFAPNVESIRVRKAMIASHKATLGQCYLFDGMSDLKTTTRLENETELYSQRQSDGEHIKITLKRTAELQSKNPELGRLFNTQMRRNLQHLKYILLGRYYYDPSAITEMPNYNLQIWPGCITSIRTQEERLMMVVDTTHKIVRGETALDIIKQISQKRLENWQRVVVDELVGAIVMTRYNNRTYRVEDIEWQINPSNSFELRDGSSLTYVEYYRKQYEINIRDMRQPLLYCTSKERESRPGKVAVKKIFLVPELCVMTGLTDQMRTDFGMMKELALHTKQDPNVRVRGLMSFIHKVNQNPDCDREMRTWGLRFSNELVKVMGRVLPAESIIQGPSKSSYDQRRGDFGQVMRGKPMHVAQSLQDWIVIVTKFDQQKCNDFLQNLRRVGPPMSMNISNPKVQVIEGDRVQNYIEAMNRNLTPSTQIVTFIVPNNKKERYDALKRYCCIDCPRPSQVVVSRTLSKPKTLMSIVTKIGIQMSCKLGAEPWAVEIPMKAGVMIIGYDTYHDSSRKGESAGGFVASLNPLFTRWYSRVAFHCKGGWEELSNHLKLHIVQALKKYHSINKTFPSIIMFYRDGVGDGQIRYVRDWEVKQFKDTIKETLGHEDTRYAFIVVNKRINTRFFAAEQQPGRFSNPPPGTCVDKVVTKFDRYDFFLVSQSVREGTVGPTMYHIVEDKSGLKPDHIQRLTYKLTHLYYNFQGTISVPAPCQYAHKLAFLCGQSLHKPFDESLSDTLFYL